MATYNRLAVGFERGEGARLWDTQGREYLDAITGIAVCGLGHAHPAVQQALCTQAGRLLHTSNLYQIPLQRQLGDQLTELTGMERAFFCNSGAEANEAAIKLARKHGHACGIDSPAIIVMEHSFHGRTLATLSATGNRKAQAGFEPLVQGFVRVPFDDPEALRKTAEIRHDICAVLVEPIQGEGGVHIPSADYLPALRQICDQQGWLLMFDEIQCGMGRSGKFLAHQHTPIQPDVLTLAKALGNGVPIGACLARGEAAQLFGPGSHGSTFGGNPLACAAALAVLEIMQAEDIPARAAVGGERLKQALSQGLADLDGLLEIRGQGMMLGIELDRPCAELVSQALEQGLLINVTAERVVRLLPPLNLSDADIQLLSDRLTRLIRAFLTP